MQYLYPLTINVSAPAVTIHTIIYRTDEAYTSGHVAFGVAGEMQVHCHGY